jgi:glutamate synthase (NADPH/NADH) large chain
MTYDDAWVKAEEAKRAWLDANGLYKAEDDEHSSCGVGLVVSISGKPSRARWWRMGSTR